MVKNFWCCNRPTARDTQDENNATLQTFNIQNNWSLISDYRRQYYTHIVSQYHSINQRLISNIHDIQAWSTWLLCYSYSHFSFYCLVFCLICVLMHSIITVVSTIQIQGHWTNTHTFNETWFFNILLACQNVNDRPSMTRIPSECSHNTLTTMSKRNGTPLLINGRRVLNRVRGELASAAPSPPPSSVSFASPVSGGSSPSREKWNHYRLWPHDT